MDKRYNCETMKHIHPQKSKSQKIINTTNQKSSLRGKTKQCTGRDTYVGGKTIMKNKKILKQIPKQRLPIMGKRKKKGCSLEMTAES